ncbi:hypothetical protein FOA43_002580 [Brettanomyces nanus]|uniref:Uncharacterized protein n=1 Tax=Eeniella nana TaxID=13502 RepID=A0A875RPL9_EENNA|nr:uncharacterized protein FOA43_002580 [Brettanomyces nanus]QPG75230.1 hypothetical protein FOA43_002580 [Brettanomyces nanus]
MTQGKRKRALSRKAQTKKNKPVEMDDTLALDVTSAVATMPMASPNASTRASETVSTIKQEYFSVPQLLSYNPWHSFSGHRSSNHGSYNPEVKILHFNGMSARFKCKYKAALDFAFTNNFTPDTTATGKYNYNAYPSVSSLQLKECVMTPVDIASFHVQLPLNSTFDLAINDGAPVQMNSGQSQGFPSDSQMRQGLAVNCGGTPIASTWLPLQLDSKLYLFASVVSAADSSPNELSSVKLNCLSLSNFSPFTAGLLIYEYNPEGQVLSCIKKILLDHGAITEFKWLLSDDGDQRLLACVFSDGNASIMKIDKQFLTSPKYSKLTKSSLELSLKSEELHILSCTWTSNSTLLVGTTEGCVAEFDIASTTPRFIFSLSAPSVLSVQSDYTNGIFGKEPPLKRSDNVLISTGDLNVILLDLSNPSQAVDGPRFRVPISNITYSSLMNGFIYADGTRTLKYSTVRDSSTSVKLRVYDEPPQSTCCSDYSPLVLAGCANGSVRILNVYRMLSQPLKSVNAASLRLYKLDSLLADGDQFRLNLGYQIDRKEETTTEYHAYSNALTVTSCSMVNNATDNNVIACTYAGGLILVESLQSVKQSFM